MTRSRLVRPARGKIALSRFVRSTACPPTSQRPPLPSERRASSSAAVTDRAGVSGSGVDRTSFIGESGASRPCRYARRVPRRPSPAGTRPRPWAGRVPMTGGLSAGAATVRSWWATALARASPTGSTRSRETDLGSRPISRPLKDACRSSPSVVHSVNSARMTCRGSLQRTPRSGGASETGGSSIACSSRRWRMSVRLRPSRPLPTSPA